MKHTQLSTTRLRFLFLAAKISSHAGRVGVSYSDHYEEKGIFQRLMDRLRTITDGAKGVHARDFPSSSLLTTVMHRILCARNKAVPTTYNIGRTQTENHQLETKKECGNESSSHRHKGDLCALFRCN